VRGVARLLGQQEITLRGCEQPSLAGRPDRAWIQAVPAAAMLDHSCAVS
jgi:hypothetical protein